MSKYINAEKLIDEIERFSATEYGGNTFGDDVANGALDYVLEEIIPSLQQEMWKPNKEQMRALNEIVNILAASPFLHQNDYLFNILNGLREELKKLL